MWINHSDFTRRDTMYCGAPVNYKLKRNDDGNRVRVYDHLCPKHKVMAAALPVDDEEEIKR